MLELFAILSHNVDHVRIRDDNVDVLGVESFVQGMQALQGDEFHHGFCR